MKMSVEKSALLGSQCAVVHENLRHLARCEQPQSQAQPAKSLRTVDEDDVPFSHFGGKDPGCVAEPHRYVVAPAQAILRNLNVGRIRIGFDAHNVQIGKNGGEHQGALSAGATGLDNSAWPGGLRAQVEKKHL